MSSQKINRIMEINNFVLNEHDYRRISNPIKNPQILNVIYDTFSDSFRISTADGYLWNFKVKR